MLRWNFPERLCSPDLQDSSENEEVGIYHTHSTKRQVSFAENPNQVSLHWGGGVPLSQRPLACDLPVQVLPTPPKIFSKIKKKKKNENFFFKAWWQLSPNEFTYLHCVIVNPVGWERLHDAHVAGKTTQHTHLVIRQKWNRTHIGVCVHVIKFSE